MENKGIWTDLISGVGLEIAEVFDQGMEEYKPGISNVLKVVSTDVGQYNVTGKTGVGEIKRFNEGDDIPVNRRYKTYTTKIVPNEYGGRLDVTFQSIEDRDFDSELSEMKDLAIGANYSQDKSGMQLFNGGFSTAIDVNGYRMTWYGDGEPLFSTIHSTVVPGGATQSNASATSIPLTATNLETALVALEQQETDDGLAMSLLGKPMLVIPPALRKEALELTESELDPSTANNAINVYKNGMAVDMAVSTFLGASQGGSDTAWYVTIPGKAKLEHIVRQEPRLAQDNNIGNLVVTFTVHARWANADKDWRRTWGSKGDATSYSS